MISKINTSFSPHHEEQEPETEDPDPLAALLRLPEGEIKTEHGYITRAIDGSIPGRDIWKVELVEQDQVIRWRVWPPSGMVSYSTGTRQTGMTTQWDDQQIGTDEHFEAGLAKARELVRELSLANSPQTRPSHCP